MKLATWNVNSIRARLDRLTSWLETYHPDVVCLQETKVEDGSFPFDPLKDLGYHVSHAGQKTYNGVAILSREAPTDVRRGLDDGEDDPQARLIGATVGGVRVISAYVPNGDEPGSPKFEYKLKWLSRLRRHLDTHYNARQPLILCGDFNVAPDERDVHDPAVWERTVLFNPEARSALVDVTRFGLIDTFRIHCQDPGKYSWWDYRMLAFPKNRGLRIDHVFATAPLAEACRSASIDREARKGKQPSDHAPVLATFDTP